MIGVGIARNTLATIGRMVRGARSEPAVSDLNFFFSTAALGGAERVHADIVAAINHPSSTVFFTEKAKESPLRAEFERFAKIEDISDDTASRMRFYLRIGSIAAAINAQASPLVFGGFSYFFYRLLPRLGPHVRCIDLLHNFGGGFEQLGLANVARLNDRIFISFRTFADVLKQYRDHGVSEQYTQRMQVIENCCDVPAIPPVKDSGPLRVLFVGRGSPEKRVHLAGEVARRVRETLADAEFTFVGDVQHCVREADRASCKFTGPIFDTAPLRGLYERAHVLLLTSDKEGFPLVIMEAMAQGCVPLSADVGGIRYRVRDGKNGFLFAPENEAALVQALVARLLDLAEDRPRLASLGQAAHATAFKYFRRERFRAAYRALFFGEPGPDGYPVRQMISTHD